MTWATNCLQCPRFNHAYRQCDGTGETINRPDLWFCEAHPRFDIPVFDRIETQREQLGYG